MAQLLLQPFIPQLTMVLLKEFGMAAKLDVATEENMVAEEATTLQEVHAAMRALGHEPEADTAPGGKAG